MKAGSESETNEDIETDIGGAHMAAWGFAVKLCGGCSCRSGVGRLYEGCLERGGGFGRCCGMRGKPERGGDEEVGVERG